MSQSSLNKIIKINFCILRQLRFILIISRMNSKNKQTLAIPFISFSQGKGFKLNEEAEEFLMSLPENRKIGVVSIVGKYRTGKSFFVNRVLLNQKKGGFQVGPTINPCTKGLWLWKKTVKSESDEDMDIIVIDTQGFGGMDENANHDSRIFLFSLLLSSFFIYNSTGSIDENALNTLNLIINLAKDIQSKSKNGGEDLSNFPSFLWIVRDFTLQMTDTEGGSITSKEYLENALQQQKGNTEAIHNKNKIRKLLRHFFTDRDCQTMVRPIEKERDLQRLDQIDNSQLRPQFVNQVDHIRNKIFTRAKAKKVSGKELNGHLLVALCKGYMELINQGNVPNVESAWYYVCRSQGTKAIRNASKYLQSKIQELLKRPMSLQQLEKAKQQLKQQVIKQFKRKSMGAEEGNPEFLEKLQKKIDQNFQTLKMKNKKMWSQKYRQKTQQYSEIVRDKIFRDEYDNFGEFVSYMEELKRQFQQQTKQGQPEDKWAHFNQIAEQLYRLAGQTITTKINKNLEHERKILQQKMAIQQQVLEQKTKQQSLQKNQMRYKIEQLQKLNARLSATEQTSNLRVNQYKEQYDKLHQKYKKLQNQLEQKNLHVEKMQRQVKKVNQNQIEEMKNEVSTIRANSEKEKVLYEMEKKYIEEELDRFKQRCKQLEGDNKKIKTNNAKISSQLEDLSVKYEEKDNQCKMLQETNNNYAKKIQNLLQQNSKKNEILGQHNEWLLEKAYLENQVSFLKVTLNENRKLHDDLLMALQQSIASSQSDCNNELVEVNKNLSSALEKMEQRCHILEQKYEKMKSLKKIFKNCTAMQCCHCGKWVQSSSFSIHLDQCGQNGMSLRQKTLTDYNNRQNIHISVSQNVAQESEDRKKPYLQYIIQVISEDKKWKISKQYRQFTELSQNLLSKFPSIKFPQSFNQLVNSKSSMGSKKNTVAEQRRKNIQHCLRDLCKIEQIRGSRQFRQFLEMDN